MSDSATPADPGSPLGASPEPNPPTSPLLQFGGMVGLLACLAGLAVMFAACGGLKWFVVSPFIVAAGAAGLLISLIGALVHRRRIGEETHVLLSFFTNSLAIIGGMVLMAVLKGWDFLPK